MPSHGRQIIQANDVRKSVSELDNNRLPVTGYNGSGAKYQRYRLLITENERKNLC